MPWVELDTVGETGSEGEIILDLETSGARITLEQGGVVAPYSITCGIYGWMVHTRFFSDVAEAKRELARMQEALQAIVDTIPSKDAATEAATRRVVAAIERFVERFP